MRIVIPIAAVLLAGCGGPVVDRDRSATPPFDGPLDAGAAVGALECDGKTPYERGEHGYDDGLARVQASAEAALDDYMRESGPIFSTPSDGYAVEREQDGRVLFSYDVDGRTKVAMLAADGVRDWNGDEGWGVPAWAQCDPSELPADVTDELNIGVSEDESGRRVPVTRIQSFQGAEHCSWTDITFLLVGREETADWYVRDTGVEFSELLRTSFDNVDTPPEGATDTGLRRHDRQLLDRARQGGGLPGEPRRCAERRALAGRQAAHPVRISAITSRPGHPAGCNGPARRLLCVRGSSPYTSEVAPGAPRSCGSSCLGPGHRCLGRGASASIRQARRPRSPAPGSGTPGALGKRECRHAGRTIVHPLREIGAAFIESSGVTTDDLVDLAWSATPFEGQREALAALLVARGLSAPTVTRVLEHVRHGILLIHAAGDTGVRLGGHGLVPRGQRWPTGATSAPLTFIGAVDLAQLPTLAPLPPDGMLLIYWDHEFHDYKSLDFVAATTVYYVPAGSELDQLDPPTSAWGSFDQIPLTGLPVPIAGEAQNVLRTVEHDRDLLIETMTEVDARVYAGHQLLGSSRDIQGPVLDSIPYWLEQTFPATRALFTESQRSGAGWLLLAQINEDNGLVIGNGGALYFAIPESDLHARRFDRVMGIMECH